MKKLFSFAPLLALLIVVLAVSCAPRSSGTLSALPATEGDVSLADPALVGLQAEVLDKGSTQPTLCVPPHTSSIQGSAAYAMVTGKEASLSSLGEIELEGNVYPALMVGVVKPGDLVEVFAVGPVFYEQGYGCSFRENQVPKNADMHIIVRKASEVTAAPASDADKRNEVQRMPGRQK